MKAYGEVVDPHLLDLGSRWNEWSVSRPGRFIPWEKAPGTNWIGRWVNPIADLEDVEKIIDPTGTGTTTPRSSSP
jgi:hypothetical protein